MRSLGLSVGITGWIIGCAGPGPEVNSSGQRPFQRERSDTEWILDAILYDIANNPALEGTREFYGTQGDLRIALVTDRDYGVPWPAWYRPFLSGWKVSRVDQGSERDMNSPRLLGVRIDRFLLEDSGRSGFGGPIEVTLLNAGGNKNGAVIGGCAVYYAPKHADGRWALEFRGALDP